MTELFYSILLFLTSLWYEHLSLKTLSFIWYCAISVCLSVIWYLRLHKCILWIYSLIMNVWRAFSSLNFSDPKRSIQRLRLSMAVEPNFLSTHSSSMSFSSSVEIICYASDINLGKLFILLQFRILLLSTCFIFWDMVLLLCNSDWLWLHRVAQDGLKFMVMIPSLTLSNSWITGGFVMPGLELIFKLSFYHYFPSNLETNECINLNYKIWKWKQAAYASEVGLFMGYYFFFFWHT